MSGVALHSMKITFIYFKRLLLAEISVHAFPILRDLLYPFLKLFKHVSCSLKYNVKYSTR
jgi:hypothetical protein